jgi:hypothetical protein
VLYCTALCCTELYCTVLYLLLLHEGLQVFGLLPAHHTIVEGTLSIPCSQTERGRERVEEREKERERGRDRVEERERGRGERERERGRDRVEERERGRGERESEHAVFIRVNHVGATSVTTPALTDVAATAATITSLFLLLMLLYWQERRLHLSSPHLTSPHSIPSHQAGMHEGRKQCTNSNTHRVKEIMQSDFHCALAHLWCFSRYRKMTVIP